MDVTRLIVALFVGMAVLIVLIMKTRLHPSLSLVISACVVGVVGGVCGAKMKRSPWPSPAFWSPSPSLQTRP